MKAKILAALAFILGIFLAALKIFGMGKDAQKAKTMEKQREVEEDVHEALTERHEQTLQDIKNAKDSDNFDSYNAN